MALRLEKDDTELYDLENGLEITIDFKCKNPKCKWTFRNTAVSLTRPTEVTCPKCKKQFEVEFSDSILD